MIKSQIFIFILVLFVVIVFYSIYLIVNPSLEYKRYNFVPFPKVKPEPVPIESFTETKNDNNCLNTIKSCKFSDDCLDCGEGYECSEVKEGQSVFVNGKQIDTGKWCLPKKSKGFGCGTYTGRAVWSNELGKQDRSCVCLYPELFGGEDCLETYACKDINNLDEDQSGNYLFASVSIPNKVTFGTRWDPTDPNFSPPGGLSPYATYTSGEQGERKPIFTCFCDSTTNQKKYVSLPNDLFRCHADPCTVDNTSISWNPNEKTCVCKKDFAKSNTDGKCRDMKEYCNPGSWNPDTNQCDCPPNSSTIRSNCSSKYFFREGEKECDDKDNPGGSVCFPPCDANNNPCKNGAACVPDSSGAQCKCSSATAVLPAPFEWAGKYCEKQCLKSDTIIRNCNRSYGISDCGKSNYNEDFCCNGTYKKNNYSIQGVSNYDIRCV